MFVKAVILSRIIFFLIKKKKKKEEEEEEASAHLQYVCNNCSKFQIDYLKTMGGINYTNSF